MYVIVNGSVAVCAKNLILIIDENSYDYKAQ